MANPVRLEVFEMADLAEGPSVLMPEDLEDLRLSAYERGFLAGWEDAVRQSDAEASDRQSRVAARIEAMTFGYHEARAEILKGLAPVFAAMVEPVLPAAARATLVPLIVQQVLPLAMAALDRPLTLRVPPGTKADVEAALSGLALPPLVVTETADLTDLQAEIVADTDEIRLDLSLVLTRIEAVLADFQSATYPEIRRA